MRLIAFVGLIMLGVTAVGAQTLNEGSTILRVEGLGPDEYVIEARDEAGMPVRIARLETDDEGRGQAVFQGDLGYPVVTIGPAP